MKGAGLVALGAVAYGTYAALYDQGGGLGAGSVLREGECVKGASNAPQVCMAEGQLTVSRPDLEDVLWQSPKQHPGSYYGVMEKEGGFNIYKEGKKGKDPEQVWSTGGSGDYLYLSRDGKLTVYECGLLVDTPVWASGAAAPAAAASKGTAPPSKEVVDPVTGIALPRTMQFGSSGGLLFCLGAGVRAKVLAVVSVSVYTVGLYVDRKAAASALSKFAAVPAVGLAANPAFYSALQQPGFTKYLHLSFARSVGSQKIVDALTAVKGVSQEVLDEFASKLMDAIGGSVGKGESVSLGWEGKDKLVMAVRGRPAGTVKDAALPGAVFRLYLGDDPVSPAAKKAFAEGVAGLAV